MKKLLFLLIFFLGISQSFATIADSESTGSFEYDCYHFSNQSSHNVAYIEFYRLSNSDWFPLSGISFPPNFYWVIPGDYFHPRDLDIIGTQGIHIVFEDDSYLEDSTLSCPAGMPIPSWYADSFPYYGIPFPVHDDFVVTCTGVTNNSQMPIGLDLLDDLSGWTSRVTVNPSTTYTLPLSSGGFSYAQIFVIPPPGTIFDFPLTCPATSIPPVNITGYFDSPVYVDQGSYNWNLTLHLSTGGTISDQYGLQYWKSSASDPTMAGFVVNSVTNTNNTTIVVSMSPKVSPLVIACGTYTVTIPSSLVQAIGIPGANESPITGSFTIRTCPAFVDSGSTLGGGSGSTYGGTGSSTFTGFIAPSASGSYLPIMYKTEGGAYYIDWQSWLYFLLYSIGILSIFVTLCTIIYKLFFLKK